MSAIREVAAKEDPRGREANASSPSEGRQALIEFWNSRTKSQGFGTVARLTESA